MSASGTRLSRSRFESEARNDRLAGRRIAAHLPALTVNRRSSARTNERTNESQVPLEFVYSSVTPFMTPTGRRTNTPHANANSSASADNKIERRQWRLTTGRPMGRARRSSSLDQRQFVCVALSSFVLLAGRPLKVAPILCATADSGRPARRRIAASERASERANKSAKRDGETRKRIERAQVRHTPDVVIGHPKRNRPSVGARDGNGLAAGEFGQRRRGDLQ